MSGTTAVAVFVKTPGVSPVKTRLASAVGAEAAERFYRLCLAAVEAVVGRAARTSDLIAYWAVAEPTALDDGHWRSFDRTWQGAGGLGERLDRVYADLLGRNRAVLLLGADAPLLTPELLAHAAAAAGGDGFAISRSADGGYALFAGGRAIPSEIWTAVPYSSSETAAVFVDLLRPSGRVAELPPLDDVDTAADLRRLVADAAGKRLLPEQAAVVEYARELISSASGHG